MWRGWIIDIGVEADDERIWFSIEIDMAINEQDASSLDLKLLNPKSSGRSVVKF